MSLLTSAATNRVLQLDGTNSYVELPPGAFTNLDEVTVEGWVKWESFRNHSRFFDFKLAGSSLWVQNFATDSTLLLFSPVGYDWTRLQWPGILSLGRWIHLAATSGKDGLSLFVDGVPISTNIFPSQASFPSLGKENYLGRSNLKADQTNDTYFHGQMDEVRVWKGVRSETQIRETMAAHLTGREPGLIGLWNFDDPANPAKDSSTNRLDGKLIGQAQAVPQTLPLMVVGRITDAAGRALTNAYVEVRRANGETSKSMSNPDGNYAFTLGLSERCDLFATDGERSAYRLGFQPSGEPMQRLDWLLTETGARAEPGSAKPADPQRSTQPAKAGTPNETQVPAGTIVAGLITSAATNRVLQLDGKGSYVELPTNILDELNEVTVEGWVKWESFGNYTRFFDFGNFQRQLNGASGLNNADLYNVVRGQPTMATIYVPGVVPLHGWCHIAAVGGNAGMQLYLNGWLVGTSGYTGTLFGREWTRHAFLGESGAGFGSQALHGEMDEVRFWKTPRTAEQIRENMGARLTGREPGLVGLWNFDDPINPGRDATTNRLHGKLIGQAQAAPQILPMMVVGRITDGAGRGLTNAYVEVRRANGETYKSMSNPDGNYAFTLGLSERCDLFATDGERSAYRIGFQPSGEPMQRLDWVLTETGGAAHDSAGPQAVPARSGTDNSTAPANAGIPDPSTPAATGNRSQRVWRRS